MFVSSNLFCVSLTTEAAPAQLLPINFYAPLLCNENIGEKIDTRKTIASIKTSHFFSLPCWKNYGLWASTCMITIATQIGVRHLVRALDDKDNNNRKKCYVNYCVARTSKRERVSKSEWEREKQNENIIKFNCWKSTWNCHKLSVF